VWTDGVSREGSRLSGALIHEGGPIPEAWWLRAEPGCRRFSRSVFCAWRVRVRGELRIWIAHRWKLARLCDRSRDGLDACAHPYRRRTRAGLSSRCGLHHRISGTIFGTISGTGRRQSRSTSSLTGWRSANSGGLRLPGRGWDLCGCQLRGHLSEGSIQPTVAKLFAMAGAAGAAQHLVEERPFARVLVRAGKPVGREGSRHAGAPGLCCAVGDRMPVTSKACERIQHPSSISSWWSSLLLHYDHNLLL
jgi:hypothetical protein